MGHGATPHPTRPETPSPAAAAAAQFVREVAEGIIPSWEPVVARRRGEGFGEAQRQWQLLRRGRYLEFNLVHDRGVKFGLDGGRIGESEGTLRGWEEAVRGR